MPLDHTREARGSAFRSRGPRSRKPRRKSHPDCALPARSSSKAGPDRASVRTRPIEEESSTMRAVWGPLERKTQVTHRLWRAMAPRPEAPLLLPRSSRAPTALPAPPTLGRAPDSAHCTPVPSLRYALYAYPRPRSTSLASAKRKPLYACATAYRPERARGSSSTKSHNRTQPATPPYSSHDDQPERERRVTRPSVPSAEPIPAPNRHACNHMHTDGRLNRPSDHRRPDDRTGIRAN